MHTFRAPCGIAYQVLPGCNLARDITHAGGVFRKSEPVHVMRTVMYGTELLFLLTGTIAVALEWADLDFDPSTGPSKCNH